MLNPLQLAYIGDTVWDLLIRTALVYTGNNVHAMHKMASARVNAGAQAKLVEALLPHLSEDELTLVKRGRNTRSKHPVPKNQDAADYGYATGFEALIGFLYLTGDHERIKALYHLGEEYHAGKNP
jgi:Uncharacterized protein conserved in bacteria